VKRSDLFLVSKPWNSFHDAERVGPICDKQLADWGIEYFDLFVIHFPSPSNTSDPACAPTRLHRRKRQIDRSKATLQETWHAMEALQQAGKARSIGISNYNGALILDLLRYCKAKPQTLQIEHHRTSCSSHC